MKKESVNYDCKCTFNFSIIVFNRKEGFGEDWEDHKYYVESLWIWAKNHHIQCVVTNSQG